jgi:hypothetical protein
MIATCIARLARFHWPEHDTGHGVPNDAGAMFGDARPDALVPDGLTHDDHHFTCRWEKQPE